MNSSTKTRLASLAVSMMVTLGLVWTVADYAYPHAVVAQADVQS